MATITYTYVQGYLSPANGDDDAKIIYSDYIDWSDNAILNKEGENIITTSDLTTYISNSISNIISSYKNADIEINDKLSEIIQSYTAADTDIIDTLNTKPGKFDPEDSNKINETYTGEIFNDYNNKAYSKYSHVEGNANISYSIGGHVEGARNIAGLESTIDNINYAYAHAEGLGTTAIGQAAHSEGIGTIAYGDAAHSEGKGTIAYADAQHVQGKYNKIDKNQAFIIGNGTGNDDRNRSNALTVDWNGNININNKFNIKEFDNTETLSYYTESGIYYYDDNNPIDTGILGIPPINNFILIVTSSNNDITQSLITNNKEYKRLFNIEDNNIITNWEEIQTISNLGQIKINVSDNKLYNPLNNLTYDGTYYGDINSYLIFNKDLSNEILNTYQYLQDGSKFLMTIINNNGYQCMQTLNILPKTSIDGYQILRTGIYNNNEIQWGDFKPMDGVGKISKGLCSEIFNDYSNNIAYGPYSHVEGANNIAYGSYSHVSGSNNINGLDINGYLGTVKNYKKEGPYNISGINTPYECVFEIDNFNGNFYDEGDNKSIQFISLDNTNININNSIWNSIDNNTLAVVKIDNINNIKYAYTNANLHQPIENNSIIVFKDTNKSYTYYPKITSDNSLLIGYNNRNYDYVENPQFVSGKYNKIDFNKARITGWGEGDTERKNIETLDTNGNLWIAGDITCGTNNIIKSINNINNNIGTSINDINSKIDDKPGKVVDYNNEIYNDLTNNKIYGKYNHIEGYNNKAKIGIKQIQSANNNIIHNIDTDISTNNININDFLKPIVYINNAGEITDSAYDNNIYRSISFTYYTNNDYNYRNTFETDTFAYIINNNNSNIINKIYKNNNNIITFRPSDEDKDFIAYNNNILKHILYAYLKFSGGNVDNEADNFIDSLAAGSYITNNFFNDYSNLTDDNSLNYLDLKNIHIEGSNNIAISNNQHISGTYNKIKQDAVRITGWGENEIDRKNIETLDTNGNLWLAGDITSKNVIAEDITSNNVIAEDIKSNNVIAEDITSNNVRYSYELDSGKEVNLNLQELTSVINAILGTNPDLFANDNIILQKYMAKFNISYNETN